MYSAALLVFREVLEAALIIGIVLAATRGMEKRGRAVWAGLAVGVGGAVAVALGADALSAAIAGMGQELFNAGVLFAAVLMLAWHNIWMTRHAQELSGQLRAVSDRVRAGEATRFALSAIVGLAILREGSEIVLFMYSLAVTGGATTQLFAGGVIGLVGGTALGTVLYLGLARIPMKPLFAVIRWLVLLLAAGLAAQGCRYLVQAGLLPGFSPLWDTSDWLSLNSIPGQLLHVLVGYEPAPSLVQLVAYLATAGLILAGMRFLGQPARPPARTSGA